MDILNIIFKTVVFEFFFILLEETESMQDAKSHQTINKYV